MSRKRPNLGTVVGQRYREGYLRALELSRVLRWMRILWHARLDGPAVLPGVDPGQVEAAVIVEQEWLVDGSVSAIELQGCSRCGHSQRDVVSTPLARGQLRGGSGACAGH